MCSSAPWEATVYFFVSSFDYWRALSLGKKEFSDRTTRWELNCDCRQKSVSPHLSEEAILSVNKNRYWHGVRVFFYTCAGNKRMFCSGSRWRLMERLHTALWEVSDRFQLLIGDSRTGFLTPRHFPRNQYALLLLLPRLPRCALHHLFLRKHSLCRFKKRF